MLGRVLRRISLRDFSTAYASPARCGSSPDASIELEVQRFDLDRDGQLLLIAQASVSFENRTSVDA
jgi:hypothetical protein